MSDDELLKMWRNGNSKEYLSDKYLDFLVSERKKRMAKALKELEKRRAAFRKQRELIRERKKKNRKYKFDGVRIVVGKIDIGKAPTRRQAQMHVETLLLADWKRLNG